MTERFCVGEGKRFKESVVSWAGKSVKNDDQSRVFGALGTAVVVRG